MNDNELSTAVRESVADIYSATPVAQIVSRGRAVRARRRIPVVAGALTVAAGTALAVTTLLPGGQAGLSSGRAALPADDPGSSPASHPASVTLAAWTVAKQANGDIDVTINQLKDPAGLQATLRAPLRADGLPVTVSFSGPMVSASCQPYEASMSALRAVGQFQSDGLTIDPSALPSGTGVAIFDEPGTGLDQNPSGTTATRGGTPPTHPPLRGPLLAGTNGPLAVGLVYASQQCTG
jgi:hypothetical protein